MPRGAFGPTVAVVALVGAIGSTAVRAEPRDVTLPRLEVPDEAYRPRALNPNRAALLDQPIELSDARDRLTLARERAAWGRLSGSLCSGCGVGPRVGRNLGPGGGHSLGRLATVDPIAVLNAKPSVSPAARPVAVRLVAAPTRPVPAATPTSTGTLLVATAAPAAAATATAKSIRRPSLVMRRSVRPTHAHRVQLAHRRRARSTLAGYFGRVRYALLRWRHHRHHRRFHR